MWPFSKKEPAKPAQQGIQFTQLDITEHFGDNTTLKPGEWIKTSPLNKGVANPQLMGLPSLEAGDDEVYALADKLSRIRESIQIPNDGVYCPVCHAATVGLELLRKPCPTCGRVLLKFGWD